MRRGAEDVRAGSQLVGRDRDLVRRHGLDRAGVGVDLKIHVVDRQAGGGRGVGAEVVGACLAEIRVVRGRDDRNRRRGGTGIGDDGDRTELRVAVAAEIGRRGVHRPADVVPGESVGVHGGRAVDRRTGRQGEASCRRAVDRRAG